MLIDWFTVVAQVVNFLILVWLLKRFLYQPILDAIDAREKRIAGELADADARKAEAGKERDEFQLKNETLDKQRAALLSQATDEAKAEGRRILDAARQDADALSARRQAALISEQQRLNEALTRRAREEVFAIARKTLADLAGASLEARMAEMFMQRVRDMDAAAKDAFAAALKAAPALVRSAFELPEAQRAAIRQALNETFSADVDVRFETAPELVSGIEIGTDGQKLAWSIADYLVSLEKAAEELLKPPPVAESKIGKSAHEAGV